MNRPKPEEPIMNEAADFSLVLGGPLYQLMWRARLAGNAMQLLRRRVIVLALLAWAPLLALSIVEGHAWGGSVTIPFFHDVEMHVRLLVALPLLIVAELVVHQRMQPVVQQFVERGLIPEMARAKFAAAIASALRLRNSITAEVLLIAFVFGFSVPLVWRSQVVIDVASWYGVLGDGKFNPTLAGWWLYCVSLPLFHFLILRWYFRLFIWARFLWHVSRIELKLMPTNPDRCGGLGFLSLVSQAFSPLLLAQGALLAGMMADRIFFAGARLTDFKVELIVTVAVMMFAVLGPLLVFGPQLEAAERAGLREYGTLMQRYGREFDQKWLRGGVLADEPLIGSADIQSLADLGNIMESVGGMRLVPFTSQAVLQLAVATLLPVAPLLLTMIPPEQLLERLLKIVF
jgi:hypothetical protein